MGLSIHSMSVELLNFWKMVESFEQKDWWGRTIFTFDSKENVGKDRKMDIEELQESYITDINGQC